MELQAVAEIELVPNPIRAELLKQLLAMDDAQNRELDWNYASDPETRVKASRIVNMAANLIRDYGWIKRRYGSRVGGFCCMGALTEAMMPEISTDTEYDSLYLELRAAFWNRHRIGHIPTWNDKLPDEMGRETVINVLCDVAAYLAEPQAVN